MLVECSEASARDGIAMGNRDDADPRRWRWASSKERICLRGALPASWTGSLLGTLLLALQLISAVFRAELELCEDSELPLNKIATVTVA